MRPLVTLTISSACASARMPSRSAAVAVRIGTSAAVRPSCGTESRKRVGASASFFSDRVRIGSFHDAAAHPHGFGARRGELRVNLPQDGGAPPASPHRRVGAQPVEEELAARRHLEGHHQADVLVVGRGGEEAHAGHLLDLWEHLRAANPESAYGF